MDYTFNEAVGKSKNRCNYSLQESIKNKIDSELYNKTYIKTHIESLCGKKNDLSIDFYRFDITYLFHCNHPFKA